MPDRVTSKKNTLMLNPGIIACDYSSAPLFLDFAGLESPQSTYGCQIQKRQVSLMIAGPDRFSSGQLQVQGFPCVTLNRLLSWYSAIKTLRTPALHRQHTLLIM